MHLGDNAQLALDTLLGRRARGIPTFWVNLMEHAALERLAGAAPGGYVREPERVYLAAQRAMGVCVIDQWIPDNPLTMGKAGFESRERTATTGIEQIERDGMAIDSPEAACEHMERFLFPALRREIAAFDEDARVRDILAVERATQDLFGPDILKTGHEFIRFPTFAYDRYGYVAYFMAYGLYPEVIERHFALQADLAVKNNRAAVRAYREGGLPPMYRLDHDMADSRGMLVNVKSLDALWLPHFARALEPFEGSGVQLLWHCDGNLMDLVPRLVAAGISGFQGFQYEDGMDYEKICRMKDREGRGLLIVAGVSVTTTLPLGSPGDVRREMKWLVDHGPRTGLFLGPSSSVTPGVPWENLLAFFEGLAYYRTLPR